jgi:cellulose synthase/poly-beta-1,6-N-acetylglucosamine synthase-like glycosyltransferase
VVRAGEGLYWRLENAVKEMEGRFGATIVATGAIYGIRRSLWKSLPPEASDDSLHPLLTLSSGYDVVVAHNALAFEKAATSLAEEFRRKARMVTRQLAAYAQVRFFLWPLRPALAGRLLLHKIIRWLVPFFLIGALAVNATLLDRAFYRWTFGAALLAAMVLALGALRLRRGFAVSAPLRFGMYVSVVNAAALVGVLDFLRGRRRTVWAVSRSTRP